MQTLPPWTVRNNVIAPCRIRCGSLRCPDKFYHSARQRLYPSRSSRMMRGSRQLTLCLGSMRYGPMLGGTECMHAALLHISAP
jgi:hypothetical protein